MSSLPLRNGVTMLSEQKNAHKRTYTSHYSDIFGVLILSRRFGFFGVRCVPAPLCYILDCGTSSYRFSFATRLVSLLYISDCVESPHRFRSHYALVPLWECGTAERSEASIAFAQATQVACS